MAAITGSGAVATLIDTLVRHHSNTNIAWKMWQNIICSECGKRGYEHAGGVHGKHYEAIQHQWEELLKGDDLVLKMFLASTGESKHGQK